ncbi:VWA domain-containing protein [Sphaerospermopsis kisseleviana CS-549]|uniref:VWA domain-containing protein n=1 Tax=Sphaerospermopsis kisseleviana CS-549 TaxID=3021783 RepID=A0ABT4ZQZ7_9CYAN|nr:VWA domain-containing protein [Sphaerospermopsis kisseleviana]MDB9441827.1 VWA domain-containing protein [Sphaerospermopsis kisseleviana CS-549]BAZ80245.1 von Willebrand factor type A [Sphaerospermopsis kisseleviana NIES-73]
MALGLPEFVENPENRCPVVLLLDTSGSMSGQPIEELNTGLVAFKEDILKDAHASLSVEVAIVTFGPVRLIQDFVTIDHFTLPKLEADGVTPMGEAIEYALDLVEKRKQTYKDNGILYYRPWVFLITDGAPTDYWQNAAQRVREGEEQRRMLFFTVAVQNADMNKLREIAPPGRSPVMLNGLDFRALFVWLSTSMKRVSSDKVGEAVALPPVGWGQITT